MSRLGLIRTARSAALACALAGVAVADGGCLLWGLGSNSAFLEADDVRIDVPGTGEGYRAASQDMVRGHVQVLAVATTEDVNAWVTSMVEGAATVVRYLESRPATATEGATRIYGPHDDNDGRDLSWLVRLDGTITGSNYELWVGKRGATSQDDMDMLMSGDLLVEGTTRSGGFFLDFDVVELFPEMKTYEASLYTYAGSLAVTFERDTQTQLKHIDIDFEDWEVLYDGFLDSDLFQTDETYVYHRAEDGSGTFHLAITSEWDDWSWSGPESEEMVLDMAWTPEGAGRTRGQIAPVEGVGDLKHGDLMVHECFAEDGYLTWRDINDEYLVEDPDYNFGDEASCALGVGDLG